METIERDERVQPRLLEDEMRESFIDYSMSVIVQRALPDVRDGLKPVHRRILYAMQEGGLLPNRPYKKSATVVGDVLGKYHPHGDAAVYDSLVRMVQDFSMRYPLVDGQGNFGSIDGDSAAAYRYTEVRLAPIAIEMLADIDKQTVDFVPNFDDRLREPVVLPARLPNLLVNGSSGIAVGMATNIPPHNLGELVGACRRLIDDPEATVEDLLEEVQGPDFPTGGMVFGEGIDEAYRTGRGRVVMRARAQVEERERGLERIVVTEIPFMVNKSRLVEQIAQLVRDRKVEDIADLRDESDRDGIRVVIELKRDAVPEIVLNKLYRHTQMQSTFGVIMLALVDGVPRVMDLREMLAHFLDHRHEVVVRRSRFDLRVAQEREHVLEGLKVAVDNIDEVIEIIRGSRDPAQAGARLRNRFELTEKQADAILAMRLSRLTGLEVEKLEEELREVRAEIGRLEKILASRPRRMRIVREELEELAAKYGDARRTEILPYGPETFSAEDLIAEEPMVITVSHQGYVKRIAPGVYRQQRRGGRGVAGMDTKEEDWVEHLYVASTHDYLMVFTAGGQCYWLKVHEIPAGGRTARGKPIVNLLNIGPEEQIASIVPVREFAGDRYLLFATRAGLVKKTSLAAYSNIRSIGLRAIHIVEGDRLIDVRLTDGSNDVILATRRGMAIRFSEEDVREMGRTTRGVRGVRLARGDQVVGMVVVRGEESTLLTVSERGMGKRSPVAEYRVQRRGGKGLINLKVSAKTGAVVVVKEVTDEDELMLVTRHGVINRQRAVEIRVIGRNTQGVRLVSLDEGDEVVDVALVVREDEEPEEGEVVEVAAAGGATGDGGPPA